MLELAPVTSSSSSPSSSSSSSFYLVKQVTKIGSREGIFLLHNVKEASPLHLSFYTLFKLFRGVKQTTVRVFAFSHFPFVLSYRQRQLVISYLLQAVASSFVEITASSCDILFLRQNLDQQNETKDFKQAAMFDRVSKSTMGWL